MIQRLPPTNWLRTFELVVRNMSFTHAARDLLISTSAVSQQIKQLEDFLGVKLFRRQGNRFHLTDAGEACLPAMHDAFDQLGKAVDQIRTAEGGGRLNVSVAPSFASKWLLGRLDRFRAAYPEVDLGMFSTMNLVSFDGNDIDIAIRYGNGLYPGLHSQLLMHERVISVASPTLIRKAGGLSEPADLVSTNLIHDCSLENDRTCPDWHAFLDSFSVHNVDWQKGLQFNQSALVIEAAIQGWGVALAKGVLVGADLRARNLRQLFNFGVDVDYAYYILCLPEKERLPKISAFIEWIMAEATGDRIPD